jgi:hypothetical protein
MGDFAKRLKKNAERSLNRALAAQFRALLAFA